VVKLSDAPGSYSAILNLLGPAVNLVGTTTYTLSDGTAMFSGFAEALSKRETPEGLERLILSSKAAMTAQVKEGIDGILVDTFHSGLEVSGDEYLLMRKEGMAHMFDQVVKMLGSGGESLLYNEGKSLAEQNSGRMVQLLGVEKVRERSEYLASFLTAQGWGDITMKQGSRSGELVVTVKDCFESAGKVRFRKGCNFLRGYFEESAKITLGKEMTSVETACVIKGAVACEFRFAEK
jgi:predicted hydrocarbon binding protein